MWRLIFLFVYFSNFALATPIESLPPHSPEEQCHELFLKDKLREDKNFQATCPDYSLSLMQKDEEKAKMERAVCLQKTCVDNIKKAKAIIEAIRGDLGSDPCDDWKYYQILASAYSLDAIDLTKAAKQKAKEGKLKNSPQDPDGYLPGTVEEQAAKQSRQFAKEYLEISKKARDRCEHIKNANQKVVQDKSVKQVEEKNTPQNQIKSDPKIKQTSTKIQ